LLTFGTGDLDLSRISPGDKVWKTSDPALDRELRQTFSVEKPGFLRPISLTVHGHAGTPLTLIARDESGRLVRCESTMPLAEAANQPLTSERLSEQLGRLGGTPFRLDSLENKLEGKVLLPVSELNRLRRTAVQELERLRSTPLRWNLNPVEPQPDDVPAAPGTGSITPAPAELIVLVRNLPQMEAALSCGVRTLYCEFEDPKKYREAVQQFRELSPPSQGSSIWVAPPRIFKTGEEWTLNQVKSCAPDGFLIRNYDHLRFFENERRIGDYSLNVANRFTAAWFKGRFGLERLTASYDLNSLQLEALLTAAPPGWFEVTIHQHMPMFHMEHCVFCAFLSTGTDYRNCGRPCDRHDVRLRDRVGAQHPVKADAGCRNTVFNALAQTGAEHAAILLDLGVRHFRLEFLNETAEQLIQTVQRYRLLLEGQISGAQLWRELKLVNQLGVTRGQMGKS